MSGAFSDSEGVASSCLESSGRWRLSFPTSPLTRSNSGATAIGGGEVRAALAEEQVTRNERRFFARRVGVVPLFEPLIDALRGSVAARCSV